MKKILSIVLCVALVMVFLVGCGTTPATNNAASNTATSTETSTASNTSSDGPVKTGLAVISSIAKSTDAGEKDGLAEVDSIVAAVTVDKDGKIVKCALDSVQTKINFTTAGKITTDLKSEFKSKQELGEAYGMKKASAIGKEWSEQATAFAKYVVGKTMEEVKGIAVNDKGTAADKELSSSVTVHIGDFMAVVEKAVANAKDLGAKAPDKLGLASVTNIAMSKDASDKDGVAQAYTTYTASTFAADGKVTSCIIDASQSNVNFTAAGKITSDLKAALSTKDELGAAYGMAKASKIGKEWNQQAEAFASYVVGKSIDEIKGVAVNQEGVPSGTELTSSVTIHIGDFQKIIEKASQTAV